MEMQPNKIDLSGKRVAVIGGGLIGASWVSLFLAKGMQVVVSDPKPDVKEYVLDKLRGNIADLINLGYDIYPDYMSNLSFEADTATAVKDVDYIQENGPEKVDFKANLWKLIEDNAPGETLFMSSSSGVTASQQGVQMKNPSRLFIGHPFNPPHLIPLVEVLTTNDSAEDALTSKVLDFYRSLDKTPVLIHKEVPGFVANRLQSAIFRECVYLVASGVVNVKELDDIVTSSLGIRWAVGGPFVSFHLGGGDEGFPFFLKHLGVGMEQLWKSQLTEQVSFDETTSKLLNEQVQEYYGDKPIPQLVEERDDKQIDLMKSLTN